jgi:DNA-binding transcriptional MerR regulator
MTTLLTVGVLARRVGIQATAVRYYDRRGLLASRRLANGYRVFDEEAVKILRFIRRARSFGFTLAEIKQIVEVYQAGRSPCGCVRTLASRNLGEIEQRIRELSALRHQLRAMLSRKPPAQRSDGVCPLIEETHNA